MRPEQVEQVGGGKPPKSVAHIRIVLKSIHAVVEAPRGGAYLQGLPKSERMALDEASCSKNADEKSTLDAEEMLERSAVVGSFAFGQICATACLAATVWDHPELFGVSMVVMCGGCLAGAVLGQLYMVAKRGDLFGCDGSERPDP